MCVDGWHPHTEVENHGDIFRTRWLHQGRPLSFGQILDLWATNVEFTATFCEWLANVPFEAYFWETPPLWTQELERPFEYVVVDSPVLAEVRAKQAAFRDHFAQAQGTQVVTFPNLGRDAMLVVPTPRQAPLAYPHLAAFLRRAAVDQQLALWQGVARAMRARISSKPVWLSTSGLGVHWLHLRLDDRPKYYTYRPYRSI
jgi:hypothetical protein